MNNPNQPSAAFRELVKSLKPYHSLPQNEAEMFKDFVNALYETWWPAKTPPAPPTPSESSKQDGEQINITVSDVHRNEQVNIVALCRGLQVILCSKLFHRKYFALVPQKGGSAFWDLNQEGEASQGRNHIEFGYNLERFPRIYVARVYAYVDLNNNSVEFWEDMLSAGLFKYWDPEKGPYAYCKNKWPKKVQMLRVYEVDYDFASNSNSNIVQTNKYRHALEWRGNEVHCHGIPVLDDNQMEQQRATFDEVLQKHGNPPTNRV
jgi:hypothetical protein